jgi:hypothetical protein
VSTAALIEAWIILDAALRADAAENTTDEDDEA